jgi:hypothetical protein
LKWGFVGPALEEAALVFGLAHLRFTQNVARPNTSTTSSSTTFLVLAPPAYNDPFFWVVVGHGL